MNWLAVPLAISVLVAFFFFVLTVIVTIKLLQARGLLSDAETQLQSSNELLSEMHGLMPDPDFQDQMRRNNELIELINNEPDEIRETA